MNRKCSKFLVFLLALCGVCSPLSSLAQGQTGNEWNGNSISSVIGNSNPDMNTVYLYNVGTKKFLNVGSYWGTSVSAYNVGMPIKLSKHGSFYHMAGPLQTPEGTYLAFGRRIDTPDTNPVSWNRVYCDRGKIGIVNGILDWTFTETSSGSKTYTINCLNDEYDYGMGGDVYLSVDNSTPGFNRFDLSYPETVHNNLGYWKIVTLKDLKEAFKEQYASDQEPADATFLIEDQDFSRSNKKVEKWVPSNFKWEFYNATDETYRFKSTEEYNYYVGMGCVKSDGYQRLYGRYWIGSVRNLEKLYSSSSAYANGTLTQTVTTLKAGWYRVYCDGFYSPGNSWTSTLHSSFFAKVKGTSEGVSNVSATLDLFRGDFNYTEKELSKVYTENDALTQSPYVKAARLFEQGKYKNMLLVYVPTAGAKLDIGIKVEGSNQSGDWTAFDNFQLQYCGNRDLILDESQTSTHYMDLQKDANYAYTLILKRTMSQNKWNSITLPVKLTVGQFKTAFGDQAKLSVLKGTDPNRDTRILFESVDLTNDYATAIQPGKLYIMQSTRGANVTSGSYKKKLSDNTEITVQAPYFVINNVSLTSTPAPTFKETSKPSPTSDVKLQFFGTQVRQTSNFVPAYSYVLGATDGKWHYTQTNMPIKGFRCWVATGDAATAKRMIFAIDGKDEGETTDIDMPHDESRPTLTGTIYSIDGRIVKRNATSLEGLPKGIYIINNRKYTVK